MEGRGRVPVNSSLHGGDSPDKGTSNRGGGVLDGACSDLLCSQSLSSSTGVSWTG